MFSSSLWALFNELVQAPKLSNFASWVEVKTSTFSTPCDCVFKIKSESLLIIEVFGKRNELMILFKYQQVKIFF